MSDERLRELERTHAATGSERDLRRLVAERERRDGSFPVEVRSRALRFAWIFQALHDAASPVLRRWDGRDPPPPPEGFDFRLCRHVGDVADGSSYFMPLRFDARNLFLGRGLNPAFQEALAASMAEAGRRAAAHWDALVRQQLEGDAYDFRSADTGILRPWVAPENEVPEPRRPRTRGVSAFQPVTRDLEAIDGILDAELTVRSPLSVPSGRPPSVLPDPLADP